MRTIVATFALVLATGFFAHDASAFHSANRYGGSTSHRYGETSHSNAWGGSSEHVAGEGTEHTNAYGGNSAHAYGGGSEHTNAYGATTYGEAGYGAVHTYPGGATAYRAPDYYGAYHPPVAVPVLFIGKLSELSPTYMRYAIWIWRLLLMQSASHALCLAAANTGNSIAARMAMMAMTTSNSINVNPRSARRV